MTSAATERAAGPQHNHLHEPYLRLLRDALLHLLYRPIDARPLPAHAAAFYEATGFHRRIAGTGDVDPSPLVMRELGLDDREYAQSLLSVARMDNVRTCVEQALADGVPGDLLEAGVWRGGVPIFMRGILRAWNVDDRSVVVADSFQGLPPPDLDRYPRDAAFSADETGRFAVSIDEVRQNFELYGLLDDQVEFVEGWFSDTLPGLADRTWAVIRLDGDLYQSTMECLEHLYPRLSPGGFVIIDDYVLPPCRDAVHDYRERHGVEDPIVEIDWAGAYWRRGPGAPG